MQKLVITISCLITISVIYMYRWCTELSFDHVPANHMHDIHHHHIALIKIPHYTTTAAISVVGPWGSFNCKTSHQLITYPLIFKMAAKIIYDRQSFCCNFYTLNMMQHCSSTSPKNVDSRSFSMNWWLFWYMMCSISIYLQKWALQSLHTQL